MLVESDKHITFAFVQWVAYLEAMVYSGLVVVAAFDVPRIVLFLSNLSAVGADFVRGPSGTPLSNASDSSAP